MALSIRKLTVNVACHGEHHASRFLFGIIVTGEIALNVAEGALNTKGGGERTHRGPELIGSLAGKNFQILRRGKWARALASLFLGAEAKWYKQQSNS